MNGVSSFIGSTIISNKTKDNGQQWSIGTLKCFDTQKKSLETRSEAEYILNNITIDNGQQWSIEF